MHTEDLPNAISRIKIDLTSHNFSWLHKLIMLINMIVCESPRTHTHTHDNFYFDSSTPKYGIYTLNRELNEWLSDCFCIVSNISVVQRFISTEFIVHQIHSFFCSTFLVSIFTENLFHHLSFFLAPSHFSFQKH